MMKKCVSLLMAVLLSISCLAGCNTSTEDTSGKSTEAVESKATETATAGTEKTEVVNVVMTLPTLGESPAGLADVEAAINEISIPAIGVRVTLEPISVYNMSTDQTLAITSGEQLDIVLALSGGVSSYVSSGCLIELDELMEKYGNDILEIAGDRISGGYYQNTLYAAPITYVSGETRGLICRKDILDKYDISIEEDKIYTLEELEELFAIIKAGEGEKYYLIAGGSMLIDEALIMADTLGSKKSYGALMLGENMDSVTVENFYASESYEEFAYTMYDWANKGYYSPDASTESGSGVDEKLKAGNYFGFFLSSHADRVNAYTSGIGVDLGTEMTYIPVREGVKLTSDNQGVLWGISSSCENPEKAMEFLNLIYANADVVNLLQFGIEGVSYQIVDQDEYGTVIALPEGETTTSVPYWQLFGVYGDRLSWYVQDPMTTMSNQLSREYNESVTLESPVLGYVFDAGAVSAECATIDSVISQYSSLIAYGAVDPATQLPEFLQALESAGINKVIEENQRQLDEWLAEQK